MGDAKGVDVVAGVDGADPVDAARRFQWALGAGFLLVLLAAVFTVIVPELSDGEPDPPKTGTAGPAAALPADAPTSSAGAAPTP